jgi:acyl-CoA synthetase (AMP-forming)/AMP-acid ligase II/acyl carrier protein
MLDIVNLLASRSESDGRAVALETETGEKLSYALLFQKASAIGASIAAANLSARRRRPRIGIVMANGSQLAVALLGVTFAAEAAPFNPASTPSEFDMYFGRADIDAVLVSAAENGPAVSIAERRGLPLLRISENGDIVGVDPATTGFAKADRDDIALVLMTSGSTGLPKLVPLSHGNVCTSAGDVCRSIGLGRDDRCLSMWEQYHIGGLVDLLLAPLFSGGSVICTRGFDAALFFKILQESRPTWCQVVPTTLNELIGYAERHSIECKPSSLRLVRSVAAALPPSLMQSAETTFGVPVIQTFGMTEAGPLIASTALPPAVRKPGSVGRSCGAEIRIVGPEGDDAARGKVGEVAVRGPNVFNGYENDADANRSAFRDGWFHTGDIGYIDGYGDLFLTGRVKQLINRGGEKVNPQEVDDALLTHPAVVEAAAFSVKHKTLGEDVAAAVVLRQTLTQNQLRDFLAERLSSFKIPGRIMMLDRLPRNPVGKIDRLALAGIVNAARVDAGHVPPRNAAEAFLVQLWSRELAVDDVGVHDDFARLGGDSLSGMRIILALEKALGRLVPNDIFARHSTVAGLAGALAREGFSLETTADSASEAAAAALVRIETGVPGQAADPAAVLEQIAKVGSATELRAAQDAMSVYATPGELRYLIGRGHGALPGGARRLGPLARIGLRLRHGRWRRKIARDLRGVPQQSSWQRMAISEMMLHYKGGAPDDAGKTLIVGFTGNQLRLMLPTYHILNCFDPDRFELLLLNDPERKMFIGGVEGAGSTIEEVCQFVETFAARREFRRVVTLGTSGGGLAAVICAINGGFSKAITIGSASPARHPVFAEKLASLKSNPTTSIVAAFADNPRDADAANQLKGILPETSLLKDKRFTSHNLLFELQRVGELARFLNSIVKD